VSSVKSSVDGAAVAIGVAHAVGILRRSLLRAVPADFDAHVLVSGNELVFSWVAVGEGSQAYQPDVRGATVAELLSRVRGIDWAVERVRARECRL
jgi:hypothetical protein